MCKALRDGTDQYAAPLELRNKPRQDTSISPAEMMFGKNARSLPQSTGTKSIPSKKQVLMKRAKHSQAIKSNYKKETDLKRLTPSQPVYYQHKEGRRPEWRIGTVRTEQSERSYIMDGKDGVYRRNRVHLRLTIPEDVTREILLTGVCVEYKLLKHMDTEKSQDANRLNKSQADSPTRSQRIRKEPDWFKDYELRSTFSFLNICACCKELMLNYQRD